MDRATTAGRILQAGTGRAVKESLDAVAETTTPKGQPRYARNTIDRLTTVIAGRTHAKAIYELCHLLNAADALGIGKDRLERFFFGYGVATAASFKARIDSLIEKHAGWRRPGIERVADGLRIIYRDGRGGKSVDFSVHFGRMPLLAALFDFLVALASYRAVDAAIREMLTDPSTVQSVQRTANRIVQLVNRDLSGELESGQMAEKFQAVIEFLAGRGNHDELVVDDGAILDFWCARSGGDDGDFRTFASIFDVFVAFVRALEAAEARQSIEHAAPVLNRDGDELDLGSYDEILERTSGDDEVEGEGLASLVGEWRSPLSVLDEEPASRVKFLNRREREALERLVESGPQARELPLSVLRAEVFGLVQGRLSQALRRNANTKEKIALMRPAVGESYADWREKWSTLHKHIERMQKAALHVLSRGARSEDVDLDQVDVTADDTSIFDSARLAEVQEECRRVFRGIARQGFDETASVDPEGLAAFRAGLGVMLEVERWLAAYVVLLDGFASKKPNLSDQFTEDCMTFTTQFTRLYRVT